MSTNAIDQAPAARPLHVLQLLGNSIVGGMETTVIRLARELPRDAFRMTALCPFESVVTSALRDAGCDVLIGAVRDDPAWPTLQMASTFVQDEGVDVLHAHLSNAHVLGALVSSLTGRPCVATIHGRAIPMLDLEAHRFGDATHLCVVCRVAYSHARALGVSVDNLHLIPNGVPDPASDSVDVAALLGLAPATPCIGFIGRLSAEKAPDAFLRVAWLVSKTHPEAAFVVIGNGPMRTSLAASAEAFGIAGNVHFLGERDDVPALMRSLSLVIVPSHAEGMPLALMEAMAAGVPVIATAVGGIPELIEHERSGLLVGPGDVAQIAAYVDALLGDVRRRQALGECARARAAVSWPQRAAALRMGALYRRLAGSATARSVRPSAATRMRLAGRAGGPVSR